MLLYIKIKFLKFKTVGLLNFRLSGLHCRMPVYVLITVIYSKHWINRYPKTAAMQNAGSATVDMSSTVNECNDKNDDVLMQ